MPQLELNEVLEETADAAFCVDPQGEICFWNASAKNLLGYAASEAVGEDVHTLLRCRDALGAETLAHAISMPGRQQRKMQDTQL